jgi:hypothetical protein
MTTEEIELLQDIKEFMNRDVEDDEGALMLFQMWFEGRIDEILRSATAQTKAEVYAAMIDDTNNEKS